MNFLLFHDIYYYNNKLKPKQMKTDLTFNQYRAIKLIIELYENAPSTKFFWHMAKIVLETFDEETA